MIQIFSIINLLIFIPLSFITLLIFRLVIFPYLRISSYKREGKATYFFPLLGFIKYGQESTQKEGDVMAFAKGKDEKTCNSKIIVTHIGRTMVLALRDPQYIREFLQKPQYYQKGMIFKVFTYLLGNGLVSAEGETWKRHRKIISNSFNFEFLKMNMDVIQNTTKEFLNKIAPDQYDNFPAISKIQEITGEIVGRIFFGENLNSYTYEGKQLTLALADVISELGLCARTPLVPIFGAKALEIPFIPKYRRVLKRIQGFRQVCFDIVKDRKANLHQGNDLLSSLLATQKLDDPELRFSDENIVDEFITFFVAGMDTTGHLIGMTLYNLTQYPEYLKNVKEEREKTFNQEKEITTDTLHKMDVLHSMLKETMRLYNPAPVTGGREVIVDHTLVDFKLKKGDYVLAQLLSAPNDPTIFENPDKFNPSRWMDPNFKIDPFAFVPFSAGPRNCIGQHLAIIEAKVILSEFLERFDFKLIDGYKFKMVLRFLYEPEDDVRLKLSAKI